MTVPARTHDLGNARNLGQTRRGRDIVLASRPKMKGLASRHSFWYRDLDEVRTQGSWVVT